MVLQKKLKQTKKTKMALLVKGEMRTLRKKNRSVNRNTENFLGSLSLHMIKYMVFFPENIFFKRPYILWKFEITF